MASVKQLLCFLITLFLSVAASSQVFVVNGHRLYLNCKGKRTAATVVLMAGGDDTTDTWDKVQLPISQFARVCSYDRLGVGRSETLSEGHPQSVDEIVSDLEGLLQTARLHSPYILVGHSIGGLYARAFDEQHDSQVSGMVLLDSSHEEQIWRFALDEPDALGEYPRWRDQKFMRSQGFLAPDKHITWQFSKPLIVIEHGTPPEPVWHQMQRDLASRSPKSQFITATSSSHYIQKLRPELVIAAVHSVIEQCHAECTDNAGAGKARVRAVDR